MKSTEPDTISEVEDVLADIVRALAQYPDEVKVTHVVQGPLVAFMFKTDKADIGRMLGKQGKHFRSMQLLASEVLRRATPANIEVHLLVDDKGPPAGTVAQRAFQLGDYSARRFKKVKDLMKHVVSLFIPNEKDFTIVTNELGTTTLVELKVKPECYSAIYGRDVTSDFGTDGHLIGAIKSLFDGVGKSNGRVIRIVLSRL